jgi:hypothetical protein
MEFRIIFAWLTICIVSIIEAQVLRTDLTIEVFCNELKDLAEDSQEYKLYCTAAKGPLRSGSSLESLPIGGR